jgi:hypothetical protein
MQAMQRLSARTAPFRGAAASAPVRARTVCVKAAVTAAPASLPVKSADGADVGTEQLALKVARPETAKGLVHRYVVFTLQNRRRVSQLCSRKQLEAIRRSSVRDLVCCCYCCCHCCCI